MNLRHPAALPASGSLSAAASQLVVDENGFCDWLVDAMPGATLAYYRGHLGRDRMPSAKVLAEPLRRQVVEMAGRVHQAAVEKRIYLLQRRHGENDYSYVAIKAGQKIRGVRS